MIAIRPDTPFMMTAEITLYKFGIPVIILLLPVLVFLFRAWRRKKWVPSARGAIALAVGLLLSGFLALVVFAAATLSTIEHPRYRAYIICEPCF